MKFFTYKMQHNGGIRITYLRILPLVISRDIAIARGDNTVPLPRVDYSIMWLTNVIYHRVLVLVSEGSYAWYV